MARLTLYDFRDLDLMLQVEETAGASGATTKDIAEQLGMEKSIQNVAIRLAWMKRFGMLDRTDAGLWVLSESGDRIARAKLKAASANSIDKVPDDSLVDVMAHVTTRYRLGDPVMATMLRREFQFGTSPRSSIWSRK